MWGWNIKKLSLTEEDGNIVLILDQCLKGAGSDVLNLVNTMIIMDMTFRIDGFLLAYERVLPFKTMSVIVTAFLFISGVYEQMTSLQWGKGETTPFHIFCSRVTGDQGKIWTRILACCQLWSQFLRFFTSTAQPYFKDAQVKSLQEKLEEKEDFDEKGSWFPTWSGKSRASGDARKSRIAEADVNSPCVMHK